MAGGLNTLSFIQERLTAGTYFVVVDGRGMGSSGDYVLEVENVQGHAVLIGHDLAERRGDADTVVGNAVLQANGRPNRPVRVLEYTQYSDNTPGGEAELTRAAVNSRAAAVGQTVAVTTLVDFTMLAGALVGQDVLLVHEQEGASAMMLDAVATAWHTELGAFLDRGGVIVVLDHNGGAGGTWQILDGMGLLTVTGATDVTSATLTVSAPTDPLAAGLGARYSAPNGSLAFPGATGGAAVISRGADPVVLHLTR